MVVTPNDVPAHQPTNSSPQLASPLRLSLRCPNCGVTGWIKWSSLRRGIHCPKCRCKFLIGSTGQLHDMRNLPQTRFTCPRCGKSGSIPSTCVVQKAECGDCRLPLVAGPDQRLHGVREAAVLHREAKLRRTPSYREWLETNFRRDDGKIHKPFAILVLGLVLGFAFSAAVVLRGLTDNSPETLARRFTSECLAGDFQAAAGYLADDDVQRVEFERWRRRHFSSIIAKFRPQGDRTSVQANILEKASTHVILDLRVTSNFLGTRCVQQVWHEYEGAWRFDACGTLAMEDVPAAPRQTADGAAAKSKVVR